MADFIRREFKTKLLLSEDEAIRKKGGIVKYELGKLLIGLFGGAEVRAFSPVQMARVGGYLKDMILEMINSSYETASGATKALIRRFDKRVLPFLEDIIHDHLHAVPLLADKLTHENRNTVALDWLALQLSKNNVYYPSNLSMFPVTAGSGYSSGLITDFFNSFRLLR